MQVYIQGKSKKAIQNDITSGATVRALEIGMFGSTEFDFKDLPNGTTVKIYEKIVGGNPYAKSYGQVKNGKLV
jgi:hypothetical protein